MKFLIVLCLATLAFASKHHKQAETDLSRAKEALDQLTFSKEEHIYDVERNVEQVETEGGYENTVTDPCQDMNCRSGWACVVDPITREPFCDCATRCPEPDNREDERSHVCSTTNVTYDSLCHFHRQKCLDSSLSDVTVDYYGYCRDLPACDEAALAEFPERMIRWLDETMEDLKLRSEEDGGLTQKEREILEEPRSRQSHAVYWKFRRLDNNPADLYLDFSELEKLRAPLVLFESCTKQFLFGCDTDQDSFISAIEFGLCLNLGERELQY